MNDTEKIAKLRTFAQFVMDHNGSTQGLLGLISEFKTRADIVLAETA